MNLATSNPIEEIEERVISAFLSPQVQERMVAIIQAAIAQAPNTNAKPLQREWYEGQDCYESIGVRSARVLINKIHNGTFSEGIHYRDARSPDSTKPHYQFHAENCKEWLKMPAAKRAIAKEKLTAAKSKARGSGR